MTNPSMEIDAIRKQWGAKLLILGHHYQRSSVVRHADERGDSLELARKAASHPEAEKIVFCGVHFMAESADILTGDRQTVYMPETSAGCPMAEMATAAKMREAWATLGGDNGGWLPVVYVNSSAEIKALCGRWGGSTCTSSNAANVFKWVFGQQKKVLFLPDEHLGANTASDLGLPDEAVAVYDPTQEGGGLTPDEVSRAQVVVWKGFCLVHRAFTLEHVRQVRERLPEAKIVVHPETPKEILRLCDAHGSTSYIIKYVEAAPPGSVIVVGTENHLVQRLAEEQLGRVTVKALSPSVCANMAKTHEQGLLKLLREFPPANEIHVPAETAADARLSLERMLTL